MKYSIIVPVFNRPDEVDELLNSLASQEEKDFEVVIVEDGSQTPCEDVCKRYETRWTYIIIINKTLVLGKAEIMELKEHLVNIY